VDFSIKKANGAVFMPFAIRFLDVLFTILFIKADNAVLLKIPQIVAMTGFLRKCIKHCINNVPQKKRQTLLHQCLSLFGVTLFIQIFMYFRGKSVIAMV